MTQIQPALAGRYTNNLSAILGEEAMLDLVAFSEALRVLLVALRIEFKAKPRAKNPAAYPLGVLVPLARNLDKMLHNRDAVRTYRSALGALAFRLLEEPLQRKRLMQRPDVLQLPMTGRLMSALVKELTPAQRQSLRYHVFMNEQLMHALGELQGSTYGELCTSYQEQVAATYKVDKGVRLNRILQTIQPVLSASDFAYLRSNIVSGYIDNEALDNPRTS